ncbi:hypothetical protein [Rugosimonospora africana]|nr:hypothetical protein [Rugosimonospora africana]
MTKPLPAPDMRVLFDILVVFQGELLIGQVSPDVTAHVIRRLTSDGLVAEDASVGELGAVIGDLLQRVRYALGEYATLPSPSPRETTYVLSAPSLEAARACQEQLIAWGGSAVTIRDAQDSRGWTMRDASDTNEWEVAANFPELAPDPAHAARVIQVSELAREHGGRYQGSGR